MREDAQERKDLPTDNIRSDFDICADIAKEVVDVKKDVIDEVDQIAKKYGLEEREKRLLAIELTFFKHNPPTDEVRNKYLQSYEELAEKIYFGHDQDLTDKGWYLRWGVNMDAVNLAMRGETGGFCTENLFAGISRQLTYVIFNIHHEEILDEHGLCVRQMGRYL